MERYFAYKLDISLDMIFLTSFFICVIPCNNDQLAKNFLSRWPSQILVKFWTGVCINQIWRSSKFELLTSYSFQKKWPLQKLLKMTKCQHLSLFSGVLHMLHGCTEHNENSNFVSAPGALCLILVHQLSFYFPFLQFGSKNKTII